MRLRDGVHFYTENFHIYYFTNLNNQSVERPSKTNNQTNWCDLQASYAKKREKKKLNETAI